MSERSESNGTTLIELVVSMGLFVALVGVTSSMTIDSWETYFAIRGESSLVKSLTFAGDRIASLTATATGLPSSATISGTTYSSGPSTLIATLPSVDATGAQVSGSSDTLVYVVTEEGLTELLSPASGSNRRSHNHIVVGPELSAVQFTIAPSGSDQIRPLLTVSLTAQAALPHRDLTRTERRVLVLRNMP